MNKKFEEEPVKEMFSSIAVHYDKANTLLSFGLHKQWNKQLINSVKGASTLLDLCSGTGEIGFGFLKKNPNSSAILLDFCPDMLKVAEKKGEKKFNKRFRLLEADATAIPLEKESVDAVTISYGIRNVKNPEKCFLETLRVLKPGGHFSILELTRPRFFILKNLHSLYLKAALPIFGKAVAKNASAYRYLAKSVQSFSCPHELCENMQSVGFEIIKNQSLFGGTATLLTANKP